MAERKQSTKGKRAGSRTAWAIAVAVTAWLFPGLGHLVLGKWGRALVYFLSVGALAVLGLALRGNIFSPTTGDAFDMLGFLADFGAGIFFLVTKFLEMGGPDVSRAAGDYGTRFFATAGVLNMLCVLDAVEIARGKKP